MISTIRERILRIRPGHHLLPANAVRQVDGTTSHVRRRGHLDLWYLPRRIADAVIEHEIASRSWTVDGVSAVRRCCALSTAVVSLRQ